MRDTDEMRARPSWMTPSDVTVLEVLSEKDAALKPKAMLVNIEREGIPFSKSSVDRAVRKLTAAGMICRLDDYTAYYEITEFGVAFLREEVELAELQAAVDADEL